MSDAIKVQAKARVQVTIEVDTCEWGGECQISQLYDQAAESAVAQIRRLLAEGRKMPSPVDGTIIGHAKVLRVITEKQQ